ncbi:unnamed protein product [Bathycoccus prasinos]
MRFLVFFIIGAVVILMTTMGVSCSDDDVREEDVDIVVPKVISRHFTTVDSKTGFPFALDPVLDVLEKILIPTSSSFSDDDDDDDEEKAEVKETFTKENPKYKGYYCPFVGHAKCEETDSPEKYHGVDAWTIDETFEGVSPPENVPLGEFDQTRKVPSPWRALGVREREGEKALKEVLRQRRRGGGGGSSSSSEEEEDSWTLKYENNNNADYFYEDDAKSSSFASSSSSSSFSSFSSEEKIEEAFNSAMRVLQFHDSDLERIRKSRKYKNKHYPGEEAMRMGIEQRFGNIKTALLDFMELLISSKETKSPMEVYIELLQMGNCFRARGELGDADYATDAFEMALLAKGVARTQNVEVYMFYGEFKMYLNELPAAKALLQEGVKQDPRNQPMYFALGNVCASQGQWEESIAAFGKAVELAPGHERSREALEAAKKHAVGSNRRMYAALCLLLLAVLACSSMIIFLMGSSSSGSKEKKAKDKESKKRK